MLTEADGEEQSVELSGDTLLNSIRESTDTPDFTFDTDQDTEDEPPGPPLLDEHVERERAGYLLISNHLN